MRRALLGLLTIVIGGVGVNRSCGFMQAVTLTALFIVSACRGVYEIRITDVIADLNRNGDSYVLSIAISKRDAESILEGEIYSHLVAFDCENESRRYPTEPVIDNVQLSNFSPARREVKSSRAPLVRISGSVPKVVWDRFSEVCVRMNGGSYLGQELASNVLRLRSR
jgi:hypothetical protein